MKLQGIWMSYLVCNLIVCIFQVLFLTRNNWDTFLGEKQVDLDNDIEIPLIDFTRVNKETEEHHILHEEVVSDGTKIK